jgi:putative ABC transport system permease protein
MNWRRFFRRDEEDAEQRRELESYVEITADEYIARGMEPESARQAARRKLGNTTRIREEVYTMNSIGIIETIAGNARYAVRNLCRNPGFTIVALLTLLIGIGANTAVFSVVNSILLRPLPYPEPGRLVSLDQSAPGAGGLTSVAGGLPLSASMYFTYADRNQSFESMGVWIPGVAAVTGFAEPEQVRVLNVTGGVLQTLRVPPALGRELAAADHKPGAPETVLISHGYWLQRFGGDAGVIGRKLMVDGRPREIVGVMPSGFSVADTPAALILPIRFDRSRTVLAGFAFPGVARLKPGVSIAQANADIRRLIPIWMDSWPSTLDGAAGDPRAKSVYTSWKITPALRPLRDRVVGNVGSVLWVVMGTLGVLMLIACANIANLMLVRAEARQTEYAVRAALGAGWRRIAGMMLTESMVLSLAGGALGAAAAYEGLQLLRTIGPANLPRASEISLDSSALLFTLALVLIGGFLFGVLPVVKYAAKQVPLAAGSRTVGQSRERHRASNMLVVVQVALALVLLIGSGLMIRTFQKMQHVEPGFTRPEAIQTFRISIPQAMIADAAQVARMENAIATRLAAIPGVSQVSFASALPMDSGPPNWDGILKEGQSWAAGERPPMRTFQNVAPAFFRTMGTRLVAGRELTWDDLYNGRLYVLVSENLARELWGSGINAIGKRIRTTDITPWRQVIGVVQDVHSSGVQEPAPATVYWPALGPQPWPPFTANVIRSPAFVIRSERAGTEALVRQVRQAVWAENAALPIAQIQTMQGFAEKSMARTSFTLVMLAIAGAMALLLGIVGIYGVLAYTVAQRRREVGIRMALGAQPRAVRGMFLKQGLILTGIGLAAGLVAAAGLSRLMISLLYGVTPLDPVTFAAMAVVLVAAAMAACYIPARRAATVDPAVTLRSE